MADWEEELGLKNVRPFERPMTAGPNDKVVGQDELGQTIYETVTGQRYSVRPATEEESKTTRAKVEDWFEKGAPLPSGEQVLETLKAMPQAAYESAAGAVRGTGTVGDALAIVPISGAVGLASRVGQAADSNVVSAMGATYRVPRYKALTPEQRDEVFMRSYEQEPFYGDESGIKFKDPLLQVFQEMELPSQGIKGSQLIKELQDNPTVRNSQLKSQEIFDNINPQKRYTKEEIRDLFSSSSYDVRAVPYNSYSTYQRQFDLVDEEVPGSYVEYSIEANTTSPNQKSFRAESQHYSDQTLAHVRLSERQSGNRRYVLIEELQSDLLQQGFVKPSKDWNVVRDEYVKGIDDPLRFQVASKITADDLKAYDGTAMDLEDDFLISYYGTANRDKIWEKGESAYIRENILKRAGLNPEDTVNKALVDDVLYEFSEVIPPNSMNLTVPPVAKTEETVRLGIETAIAHAAQNGMTSVVIPPFEEIVKKRFTDPDQIAKAMDPKSGFYATYVKGVEKVLKDLKAEYGDAIKVDSIDLEYDPNKSQFDFGEPDELIDEDAYTFTSPEQMFFDENFKEIFADRVQAYMPNRNVGFEEEAFNRINEIGQKIINRGDQTVLDALGPEDYDFYSAFRDTVRDAYPDVNFIGSFQQMIDEDISLTQAMFDQVAPKPKVEKTPITETKRGIEIDFEGLVNEGYDLTRPKFAEGGMVENIDPISGNEVPPGAKPEEVRDDVPIMASEGEYVIPANVVRYIGLDRIEKMVKQAKEGLSKLDAEGRIGGEKATMDEDLPFSPEELVAVDEAPAPAMMAEGGMVTNYDTDIDPVTGLPRWLLEMQKRDPKATTPAPAPTPITAPVTPEIEPIRSKDRPKQEQESNKLVGLAKPVRDWSVEDYSKYADFRTSPDSKVMGAFANLVPLGGLVSSMGQRVTERNVNKNLTEMLRTGKDLSGKPLSTDQLNTLRASYSRVTGEPISRLGGISGAAVAMAQDAGLVRRRTPTQTQVENYNQRVQGDGLINKAIDFLSGNPRPTTTSAASTPAAVPATQKTGGNAEDRREISKSTTSKGSGAKKEDIGSNNSKTKTTKSTKSSSKQGNTAR